MQNSIDFSEQMRFVNLQQLLLGLQTVKLSTCVSLKDGQVLYMFFLLDCKVIGVLAVSCIYFLDYEVIVLLFSPLEAQLLGKRYNARTLFGTRKRRPAWLKSITESMKMNVEKVQSNNQQN